jgi:predicted lipoprotein with Yx(FWY)xxD motif
MRRILIPGVGLILVLALAACAPGAPTSSPTMIASPIATITNQPTESVPVTGETETSVVPATSAPAVSGGTSTAEAALTTATSETTSGTGSTSDTNVRIGTSTSTSASEPFLVDQLGRALYLYTADTQNSGSSACTAECLTQWQPVVVTGIPQAGNGANAALLGTITREDGTLQATYNGWPLYTYTGDSAPGTTSGQGMAGAWFLVSGAGNSIQK